MNEPEEFEISFEDVLTGGSAPEAPVSIDKEPDAPEAAVVEPPVVDTLETEEPGVKAYSKDDLPPITPPAVDEAPAAPITDEEDEDDSASLVNEIKDYFGYEVEEDYEDTPKGLKELTKTVATKMAIENLDTLFEKFPTVRQHLEFVQQGGDPRRFMQAHSPEVDYAGIEIADEDVDTQKALVQHYFSAKGDEPEFIQDRIEAYEDKGTLKTMAEKAQGALAAYQEQGRAELMQRQREIAAKEQRASEEVWGQVTSLVSKNDSINGLQIAQKERTKFLDYISKPVDRNGNTQRDVDSAKLTLEQQLSADYLLFKGMKLDSFIGKKAKTAGATSLRERMELNSKKAKGTKHASRSDKSSDIADLDLNLDNFG